MLQVRILFLSILVLTFSIGCSSGPSEEEIQETIAAGMAMTSSAVEPPHQVQVTQEATATPSTQTPSPTEIIETPQLKPTDEAGTPTLAASPISNCDGANWEVVPLALFTATSSDIQGEPDLSGFKYIVIPIAFINNSQYMGGVAPFGQASRGGTGVTVTTEDGFTYETDSFQVKEEYPNLYKNLGNITGILDGRTFLHQNNDYVIPPGFAVRGLTSGGDAIYGNWFQLVFKVAETQNHFTVEMTNMLLICYYADGQVEAEYISFKLNMDTDLREVQFPTSLPDNELASFEDIIDVSNKGTLELLSMEYKDGDDGKRRADFRFKFNNASEGYETQPLMRVSLIGSDGIIRYDFWGESTVGPGQSVESEESVGIMDSTENLKFYWFEEPSFAYRLYYGPYDLPD